MEKAHSNPLEFSISTGGPLYKLFVRMHVQDSHIKLALIGLGLTWLPLLIITAFEGTLYSGTELPFLKDVAMQARILVALPILLLINVSIDSKVSTVLKYLSETLLDRDEQHTLVNTALRKAKRLTDSAYTEIVFLLIVIFITTSFVRAGVFAGLGGETSSWLTTSDSGNQSLSLAGYWAVIVSIPFFQFLLLRWLWRYVAWTVFIYRFSKSGLDLMPTHADRSGGLGIIMLAQKSFGLIFVAGSVVVSGQFIAQLLQHPEQFDSLRGTAIGYIVISLILIILPLLFFIGNLTQLKNSGLMQLSNLGVKLSRGFERDWLSDQTSEKSIEGSPVDPSMIYDYGGMYDTLQQIRVVPIHPRDLISMGVMLLAPFLPILFIHYSVAELLQRIAGMLM